MKKLSLALALTLLLTLCMACFSVSAAETVPDVTKVKDPNSAGVAMFQYVEGYGYTWNGENSRYQDVYAGTQSAVQSGWKYNPIAIYRDGIEANFITIDTSSMGAEIVDQYSKAKVYYSDEAWAAGTDIHWRADPLASMTEIPVTFVSEEGPGYSTLYYKFAGKVTGKTFIIVWWDNGYNPDGSTDGGHLNFALTAVGYDSALATDPYVPGDPTPSDPTPSDPTPSDPGQGTGTNPNAGTADFVIVSAAVAAVAGAGVYFASKKRR